MRLATAAATSGGRPRHRSKHAMAAWLVMDLAEPRSGRARAARASQGRCDRASRAKGRALAASQRVRWCACWPAPLPHGQKRCAKAMRQAAARQRSAVSTTSSVPACGGRVCHRQPMTGLEALRMSAESRARGKAPEHGHRYGRDDRTRSIGSWLGGTVSIQDASRSSASMHVRLRKGVLLPCDTS